MSEELIIDLAGRVPYNVVVHCSQEDDPDVGFECFLTYDNMLSLSTNTNFFEYKPYLRSMASMTEEERIEYELLADHCMCTSMGFVHIEAKELIDWLNAHHFDYRCLIDKGLAIEVTKENDPYH